MIHKESHKTQHAGWLRAAVLGANDGIVSIGSLIIGVASATHNHQEVLLAGVAGLCAGALSMAAGEYISVSSQADTEKADLKLELRSLQDDYEAEQQELAEIYRERGLDPQLADEVALQLMQHDALGAHARDEIGIANIPARPIQAAVYSGATFTLGASLPMATAWLVQTDNIVSFVSLLSLLFLAGLGIL